MLNFARVLHSLPSIGVNVGHPPVVVVAGIAGTLTTASYRPKSLTRGFGWWFSVEYGNIP